MKTLIKIFDKVLPKGKWVKGDPRGEQCYTAQEVTVKSGNGIEFSVDDYKRVFQYDSLTSEPVRKDY